MILDQKGNPFPKRRYTVGFKPQEIHDSEPPIPQGMPPLEDVIGFLVEQNIIVEVDPDQMEPNDG